MNKELEEAIKILKHYLEIEEFDSAGDFLIAIDKVLNYMDNSISKEEYNKIKEELEEYKKQLDLDYVRNNFISKKVVEEKIKELNKLIIETQKELGSASKEYIIYVYQEAILQELLEGK